MEFYKYQGTGNDFILIDARNRPLPDLDVAALCHRRFGIGADGLMYLTEKEGYDFEMIYYNSDGKTSSMCGNGGRCIAMFAHHLGLGNAEKLHFLATDGPHVASILNEKSVALGMNPVSHWDARSPEVFVLNTGSPHYVVFTENNPAETELVTFARSIRYNDEFAQAGINVNLVKVTGVDSLRMRTYERGVEDETYSCGTGVTAAAIAFQIRSGKPAATVQVKTPGGTLKVHSKRTENGYADVVLEGPAEFVFKGMIV